MFIHILLLKVNSIKEKHIVFLCNHKSHARKSILLAPRTQSISIANRNLQYIYCKLYRNIYIAKYILPEYHVL